jgi:hypothetical protein
MAGEVWVDIPDSWCDPDSPEMTSLFFALRDNQKAFAQGDPTAPTITSSLFNIGGGGYDGACGDAFTFKDGGGVLQPGFFDVTAVTLTAAATKTLPCVTLLRCMGNVSMLAGSVLTVDVQTPTIDYKKLFNAVAIGENVLYQTPGALGDYSCFTVPQPNTPWARRKLWASKRPWLGRNAPGIMIGGLSESTLGQGGGSLVIITDGSVSFGNTLKANGGATYDAGGGSIIIIALGGVTYLTGATLNAKGGTGGGEGGFVGLYAPSFSGSRTIDVTGSTAGFSEEITMTAGQIKQMLWGR